MTVVNFTDFVPNARFDGHAWTVIKIEESLGSTGPWTLIDTINITPVDTDPSKPAPRSFTTDNATLAEGWYRVSFQDNFSNVTQAEPILNSPTQEDAWLPTVREVALKILSRTKKSFGVPQGTFTADTTPNQTDVVSIIQQSGIEVADATGDTFPSELYDDVSTLVALRSAMNIETSFFSDQVNTGRSIYPQLEKEYERQLKIVQTQISAVNAGDSKGPVSSTPSMVPSWSFPTCGEDLMTKKF